MLLILTACLGVTLNAACMKILSEHTNIFQIVALRSFVCSSSLFTMCRLNGISLFQPKEKVHLFFMRGIFGATAFVCLSLGLYELPLSESSFMTNSYPGKHSTTRISRDVILPLAVTAVLSWMFGMEHLGALSWTGVFGCIVGNALVAHPPFLFGGHEAMDADRIIGIVAACCGNIFMSITFITLKSLSAIQGCFECVSRIVGSSVNSMVLTTFMHFFSLLFSLPFLFTGFPLAVNTHISVADLMCYLGTCLTGTGAQLAMSRALQIGPPTKVTSIFMTNMLLTGLVGVVFLNEKLSLLSGIGALVIILSVLLVTAQGPKRSDEYRALSSGDDLEEGALTEQ